LKEGQRRRPWKRGSRLASALMMLSLALLGPPAARADLAKATAHFEKGTRLYSVGDYEDALKEFKAGYVEEADASFVYNVAQCYRQLNQLNQALFSYRRFLSLAPDTPLRPDVERKIEELESEVRRQRAASMAADPPGATANPPSGPVGVTGSATRAADDRPSRWPAWLGAALTVGFAGGATALTLHTNRRYDDLRERCGNTAGGCTDAQIDQIRQRGLLVNVLWGLTGVSAVATGIAIYATGDETGASVAFRF
jgi:tetratricopeptide (TPR) repeat protein